ncbi:MAG: GTP pyrophosphokinase family protein [Eubacteriales bacterium]|nr:GTP pyrophosphokinase family protein [Eubacteriales bacterium]
MDNDLNMIIPARNLPREGIGMFEKVKMFEQLMTMYNCAIREVQTKFEVLNDDLSVRNRRNPIEMIKTRIKSPESIAEKLRRRGLEVTIDNIVNNLNDVAGVRIVCAFVDDIYAVADMFTRQDDIKLVEVKDYIKNPKPNGYRSYHMIIEVPVFFADRKQMMRVEVQFRTIAMDFWASLEHSIKYKKNVQNSEMIYDELKVCSDTIAETDLKMMNIRKMSLEED